MILFYHTGALNCNFSPSNNFMEVVLKTASGILKPWYLIF